MENWPWIEVDPHCIRGVTARHQTWINFQLIEDIMASWLNHDWVGYRPFKIKILKILVYGHSKQAIIPIPKVTLNLTEYVDFKIHKNVRIRPLIIKLSIN